MLSPAQQPTAGKRKRNARACDRCHKHATKCSPGEEGTTCSRCTESGSQCTYTRPKKRRGPTARRSQTHRGDAPVQSALDHHTPEPLINISCADSSGYEPTVESPQTVHSERLDTPSYLKGHDALEPKTIDNLVDLFYYVGYPLRPYFHWPTYRAQVQQQLYRSDWGVFVITMAICCLAAGRLDDGIDLPENLQVLRPTHRALVKRCYHAAIETIPRELDEVTDWYSLMKAKALLASACLQNEDVKKAIMHGGDYVSLSSVHGFHDESNWPGTLSERDLQERRRLFWGMYQHDQHMAKSFGFTSRLREAKASVRYPAEVQNDADIEETSIVKRTDKPSSFLRGWNFCTDLYRMLENMDALTRPSQSSALDDPGGKITSFLTNRQSPKAFASDSLRLVSQLYDDLPSDLKRIKPITGDPNLDRLGFVASNILITSQTLRMVLVGVASEKPSVHLHCAVATELLDELSTIPLGFFHATSTVTLHHLAQVGHMLASVIQQPITTWTYIHVRNILLILAEFLAQLESTRSSNQSLAIKLRNQISRIDKYMQQVSRRTTKPGLFSIGQSLLSGQSGILMNPSPSQHESSNNATTINPPTHGQQPPAAARTNLLNGNTVGDGGSVMPTSSGDGIMAEQAGNLSTGDFDMLFDDCLPQEVNLENPAQYILPSDLFSGWPDFLN